MMAGIGVFGVLNFMVSQRVREISIRRALGAGSGDVLLLILRNGLTLAGIGLAVGLALSLSLSRVLESEVFGITTTDVATYCGAAALLFAVAMIACYLPAQRAANVDPASTLRFE